jgi:hypothetical protein
VHGTLHLFALKLAIILLQKKNNYYLGIRITYLPTMLQDSIFHYITKHLNGAAETKNAESSAHIKSLERGHSNLYDEKG